MPRSYRWLRSLRRELQQQRRENPRALSTLMVLWLMASGSLGVLLWHNHWQELARQSQEQGETYRGLLDLRVTSHKVTVLDWGHWDPMHHFAADGDPGFVNREVAQSSIISDGQSLLIVPADGRWLIYPSQQLSVPLQRCLAERIMQLQQRSRRDPADRAYGFYCRGARADGSDAVIGAGTAIRRTGAMGEPNGWLLHFSDVERPSYNQAVNAAFRSISAGVEQRPRDQGTGPLRPLGSISDLLPPGQIHQLRQPYTPLQHRLGALQESLLPWLFLNGLMAVGACGGLLGLRRQRLKQRRADWFSRNRLRRLRHDLPGPLLTQRELLDLIDRDAVTLGGCWIAALRMRVTQFSGTVTRSGARSLALRELSERLQRLRGTRYLALGEENNLLLVFRPDDAGLPEQELDRLSTLLQAMREQLAGTMKLAMSGLITPLDRLEPRQQLTDLALVLSQIGREHRALTYHRDGVDQEAELLRQQLRVDFSMTQVVENLQEHRYQLEPVMDFSNNAQCIAYSEMLFRLPAEMDQSMSVQEVILSLERNNNVHLIDQLMLRKAIDLLHHSPDPTRKFGINLSAVTFGSKQHFEELMAQLRYLPEPERGRLVMEVTETAIVEKPELWGEKLQQLRDFGVQIAIDDFGVGFASIAYLFRFQADYLKLDLSYSQRLDDSNVDALVDFLLTYAAQNACQLILEGIETREQLEFWQRKGVRMFQGYLFHRDPIVGAG